MNSGRWWLSATMGLAICAGPFSVMSAEVERPLSLEERIAKLETAQTARNQALVDMQFKLAELQSEIRELRGLLEQHGFQINQLTERQREIYKDVDSRLADMQKRLESLGQTKPKPLAATTVTTDPAAEAKAYERIFPLVRDKKYEEAITAYRAFLAKYPNGRLAVNAHYWLGQVLFVTGELDKAAVEFNLVAEKYPDSSKTPDALLKLGEIAVRRGDKTKAQSVWRKLTLQYPKSSAARVAAQKLKNLDG